MTAQDNREGQAPNYIRALALLTSLFFMWGFLTSMNDILIPYFKGIFALSKLQANLVQFAFFGAYFLGSLAYFLISILQGDPIARLGYQKGIVGGLLLSGVGAVLFLPAASQQSYPLFLSGLFTLGLGFTLLQIAANPFVAILGRTQTASSRLNLSQGLNSLGTVLGPLILGVLLFGRDQSEQATMTSTEKMDLVREPYMIFAGILFLLAVLFLFVKLPQIGTTERVEARMTALRYPQLAFGVIAIFMYVGAEVSIGSNLIFFCQEVVGLSESEGSPYVSIFWGGLMIGRLVGAVSLSRTDRRRKAVAMVAIPVACFFFLTYCLAEKEGTNYGDALQLMWPYSLFVGASLLLFLVGRALPGRTTMVFALACIALLVAATMLDGKIAMWCIVAVGLFNSVMWSNIFSMAIEGLGRHTSQGSSLLVMAIVGGALFPLGQGWLADSEAVGTQASFLLPAAAFIYIAWYGAKGHELRNPEMQEEVGT